MTKKRIRQVLKQSLLIKPSKKWAAIAFIWERGIYLAWSALLNVVALLTGNAVVLLWLYLLGLLSFCILYFFVAKGK